MIGDLQAGLNTDVYIPLTVGYLQSSTDADAAGTAARLLANLALDQAHIPALHKCGVVRHLSQLLARGNVDVNCRKNVVRALRLLCGVQECLEELKQSDGVPLLLECLKAENVDLALGALQAMEVVSGEGDQEVLQWLCSKEIMQCVVRYCNHSKPRVKQRAMNVLLNSAHILDGRMALSSAAGVETMVAFMESSEKASTIFHKVVCALCTCCRDVISRQRLRDCGGLERLITMLADPTHSSLHGHMMAALVCYYFDETTLKLMVTRMGLVQTLCYHLREITMEQNAVANDKRSPLFPDAKEENTIEIMESEDQQSASSNVPALPPSPPPSAEGQQPFQLSSPAPSTKEEDLQLCLPTIASQNPDQDQQLFSLAGADISVRKRPSTEHPSPSTTSNSPPPPSKRPHLEEENSLNTTPTSFLDSLLSSPNPYQTTQSSSCRPPVSPLIGDGHSTFEAQVIMMISRMSHMIDCVITLSYPDTVLTLLSYLVAINPPNNHISKVLTRIFTNPHCFQNCITALVPSKLHQIIRRSDPPPCATVADPGTDLLRLCRGLMGHLAKIAESPYGQGVLAHLLLRGSEKERQASCLSLPLLCRCDL